MHRLPLFAVAILGLLSFKARAQSAPSIAHGILFVSAAARPDSIALRPRAFADSVPLPKHRVQTGALIGGGLGLVAGIIAGNSVEVTCHVNVVSNSGTVCHRTRDKIGYLLGYGLLGGAAGGIIGAAVGELWR